MSSVITPELILTSHQFLDSSHYTQLFNQFKTNVETDSEIGASLITCKTQEECVNLFFKHFQWEPVPDKYSRRLQKNSSFSTTFRLLGNENYKKRAIPETLRCYNLALQFAPNAPSELKGLAYANRSALFFSVGLDQEAATDCEKALELEIENEIKDKLKQRLEKIGKLMRSKAQSQGQLFLKESAQRMRNNTNIKYANSFVSMKVDEIKGRSLVNDGETISPGVMILADPGYLMITNKQLTFDTEHCSNCGICVLNGIPSDENVFSYYCSSACMSEFQETYPALSQLYEYFHFTDELQDCLLISKIFLKTGSDFRTLEPSQPYDCMEYQSVFNMIAHYEQINLQDLISTSPIFKAIFLSYLLSQFVSQDKSLEKEKLAFLIFKHLHNLKYNMITLSEWRTEEGPITHSFWKSRAQSKFLEVKSAAYATGLFTLVAFCNHSCAPNCIFVKNPGVGFGCLISVREIQPEEEFTICYNQPWERLEFDKRRKYLENEYKFRCQCWACERGLGRGDIVQGGEDEIFKDVMKKGDELLKKKEFKSAMEMFVKMLGLIKTEKYEASHESFVQWQEFGRRVGVEVGMW